MPVLDHSVNFNHGSVNSFLLCCRMNRSTLSGLINSMTAVLFSLRTLTVRTLPHAVVIALILSKVAVAEAL